MTPILECRNLCFSYHSAEGETEALRDISFTVFPGTFTAIVGPSGCGKSTLLSLICGLIPPERGEIISDNIHIGYMLQRDHLLEWRTVYENVILGLEMQHQCTEENLQFVRQMLTAYGLADFADAKPSALSGGMRQRAALIRTMAIRPELLLLDEPFSALDYQTRLEVADDIGSLIVQSGKTAILVTHDLSEAISLADRVIVLTRRPAEIRCILPLDFEEEHGGRHLTSLEWRNSSAFPPYFQKLWTEVRQL
ncbi:MAG: ABC transporter ATP-binding protein [Lachnospiraceae bacterium]|nr:ABC transporter ATP-binding protein [Lachnospiraceae bacterium]